MEKEIALGREYIQESDQILMEIKKTPYAHLLHSMIIAGEEGMGKSYLLAHILKQISETHPKEGILLIRVNDKSPPNLFQVDDYLILEDCRNFEIVYNACAQLFFRKKVCLDISSCMREEQKAIFLQLLNRIYTRFIPLHKKSPSGIIAIDDADTLFEVPGERNCEIQLGENRFGFYQKSESERKLEELMFKELKSREIAFIIVCEDPSSIHPFIVQRSLLRVFFRLKPLWEQKLRRIIQI